MKCKLWFMLFVLTLAFLGCEDEPVKVVKSKPKPSADDWIGTWEIELVNGESFSHSLVNEFKDYWDNDKEEGDPEAELVESSATYVFSNNGTYLIHNL